MASAKPAHQVCQSLPFANPAQFDPALQLFLEQASSQLCRWLGSADSRPPLPGLSVLPEVEPQQRGLGHDQLLADLQLVMEGAYNPGHPGALAHLDPPPLTGSVVADLICAGLNNNLLAEELAPSLSRLETSVIAWLASQLGLPEGSGGVAASGGSLSNLMALVVARAARGLQGRQDAVVLASADAHVSLAKALMVMGLPRQALRAIAIDGDGRLNCDQLEQVLQQLRLQGVPVLAVVATAGTTVRGAVDPLEPMATLCNQHGVWLHVDGAIGAVFGLAPNHRHRVEGIGRADSLTVNPQKLLGITKTSSVLLLAEPQLLSDVFHTGLPYMEPSWGGGHGGERGLQGSRPAEILKLWLGLRQLGMEGIGAILDGAIDRRRQLSALLAGESGLRQVGGATHLLAFTPAGLSPEQAGIWSEQTRQDLLSHQLMLSRPLYQGHHHLKAVLGNPHTQSSHLEQLALILQASLSACGARQRG
ncbi:aminotransferase class V-fold PLP-dependent enzyme [Cyanobium sp. HWJ4-Hawea]|uniref:pyridoxal phosphate-dependent decarboxylase family protein n=1 Tax=Cyanobium sp. HWJ4-Hawea TaxID=2823713 RepID=UPI0020CF3A3B|nr:aminotransferase class V-fold PLP-dependent enzyme [Cyanobium sp. HWJ4-Hawea]MCP9808876.1 aminotransferase class V-fold PLP-dependent enzyme [Cyanobium sp. HWJ4-Hawea]